MTIKDPDMLLDDVGRSIMVKAMVISAAVHAVGSIPRHGMSSCFTYCNRYPSFDAISITNDLLSRPSLCFIMPTYRFECSSHERDIELKYT